MTSSCPILLETILKTSNRPNVALRSFGYYKWRHVNFYIPIARPHSTGANFVTVNLQCVILNSKVFKCLRRLGCSTRDFSSKYTYKFEWTECARERQENGKTSQYTGFD